MPSAGIQPLGRFTSFRGFVTLSKDFRQPAKLFRHALSGRTLGAGSEPTAR